MSLPPTSISSTTYTSEPPLAPPTLKIVAFTLPLCLNSSLQSTEQSTPKESQNRSDDNPIYESGIAAVLLLPRCRRNRDTMSLQKCPGWSGWLWLCSTLPRSHAASSHAPASTSASSWPGPHPEYREKNWARGGKGWTRTCGGEGRRGRQGRYC